MLCKWKVIRAVIKSLKQGSSYYAAAKAANIGQMTLLRWRATVTNKKGESLGNLTQRIWDDRVENVEDAHYKLAMNGNWQAQQFFLTNRKSIRWRKEPEAQFINQNTIVNGIKNPGDLPPMQRVYVASPHEIIP